MRVVISRVKSGLSPTTKNDVAARCKYPFAFQLCPWLMLRFPIVAIFRREYSPSVDDVVAGHGMRDFFCVLG